MLRVKFINDVSKTSPWWISRQLHKDTITITYTAEKLLSTMMDKKETVPKDHK